MNVTLADLQTLVGLQLGIAHVDETARFVEELGAESADILNIVLAVEDKYHISIDESKLADVRSTTDLYVLVRQLKGEA